MCNVAAAAVELIHRCPFAIRAGCGFVIDRLKSSVIVLVYLSGAQKDEGLISRFPGDLLRLFSRIASGNVYVVKRL